MTYTNEKGTIKLYGDGGHGYNICAVEGLEPPTRTRRLESYIGEDGCVESSSQYNQRIITVSGDVQSASGGDFASAAALIKQAAQILCEKGTLTVDSSGTQRKITVNEATVSIGERYGNFCTFVIQMTCDYPHFTDVSPTETAIFKINNFLTKDSVFPLVLSERISTGSIYNSGDIKIYPVIIIRKTSDKAGSNTITITNATTGKSLVLNKSVEMGEEIVIDVKGRRVTSSKEGNIIGTLDRFYTLSDMWLARGENNIEADIGGSERGLEVTVVSSNEYAEAI